MWPADQYDVADLPNADGVSLNMCHWEEFLFSCNHSALRLKSYCHFARNHPRHRCFGVKVLRDSWQQGVRCEACRAAVAAATAAAADTRT